MWNQMEPYTTREWRTNKHTGEFMGGINLNTIPTQYPYMIISERGGNDLYQEFKKVKTPDQFYTAIIRLNDIVKGVQMLLNKDFVHPDLKSKNAIVAGDRYKMIDLADVKDVRLCHNHSILSKAIMYNTWPSTNVFFEFLLDCERGRTLSNRDINKVKDNTRDVKINNVFNADTFFRYFQDLYADFYDFNEYNIMSSSKISSAFSFKSEEGFTNPEIEEMQLLRNTYWNERTFGLMDTFTPDNVNEFIELMKINMPPDIEQFNNVSKKISEYFIGLAETNPQEFSRELYTRLDLHTIGVMMLELLYRFKSNVTQQGDAVEMLSNDEDLRKNILRLHRIAWRFYLQNDVVTTDPNQMEFSKKKCFGTCKSL